MNFSENFLNYFNHLDHVGVCDVEGIQIVSAEVGKVVNQDVLQFSFGIKDAKIVQARFKATGMPATFAAAECACCWLEGKSIMDVEQQLSPDLILEFLELNKHYIHIANLVCLGVSQCLRKI